MNKKLNRAVLSALILITAVSCAKKVDKMKYNDNVAANASDVQLPLETEAAATPAATTEPTIEATTAPLEKPDEYVLPAKRTLDVENILQNPELPTGCEITSLAIALNYCGFNIDKVELCDNYLPIEYNASYTFNEAYIGDPKANNGFGCYAPVIKNAAENYFKAVDSDWKALDLSGTEFTDLFYQIEQGRPVIIWASMNLRDVNLQLKWTTPDGDEAWFTSLEHCMALTGYDIENGIVYAADPLKGNVEYSLERFQSVYEQMGKQAVIIYGEDKSD